MNPAKPGTSLFNLSLSAKFRAFLLPGFPFADHPRPCRPQSISMRFECWAADPDSQLTAGYTFAGGWHSIAGDIEEVMAVAEFDNMEASLKARATRIGGAARGFLSPKRDGDIRRVRTKFLIPVHTANRKC